MYVYIPLFVLAFLILFNQENKYNNFIYILINKAKNKNFFFI